MGNRLIIRSALNTDVYNSQQIAEQFPEMVDPELLAKLYSGIDEQPVSAIASFSKYSLLGNVASVDDVCTIRAFSYLGDDVSVGDNVHVGNQTILNRGVHIAPLCFLGSRNFFAEDSGTAPTQRGYNTKHTYPRSTSNGVIVGPGVILPSEFQIGSDQVIPTQASIRQIGRYGSSRRMVTAHGSDNGEPAYSVGCQFSITYHELNDRVINHTDTTTKSSRNYLKHLPEIQAAGATVQSAYERDFNLVDELRERHAQALQSVFNKIVGVHHLAGEELDAVFARYELSDITRPN